MSKIIVLASFHPKKDRVKEVKEINKIQQHGFSKRIEALEKTVEKKII